jgi:hypothetical protein
MQIMTARFPAGAAAWSEFERIVADREMSVVRYALILGLITAIPVGLIVAVAAALGEVKFTVEMVVSPWPLRGLPVASFVMGLVDSVILTPFAESGLALLPIWFLRRLRVAEPFIPLIACAFWALLHARAGHLIQMIQAWPFYCFTLVLMKHEKPSVDRAWLRSSLVHSVHNTVGMLWAMPVALLTN